jgi:hypothetical protein
VLFAEQKKKLLEKLKLQRTTLSVKDQKEKLTVYIANPESLVGCAIHHKYLLVALFIDKMSFLLQPLIEQRGFCHL